MTVADLVLRNGRIATLDPSHPEARDLVIADGKVVGVDCDFERGPHTKTIDLRGRRVIPGLFDSHIHVLRGGLNFNLELRWEGVRSLGLALDMLRAQAARTPSPHWVRVVGGWSEFQFRERRLPTLAELNEAAPDTPVFVLHLYSRALLNAAALRACGYTKDTPDPPGGEIQRDRAGNPTGMLIARPSAAILYATLGLGPTLPPEQQLNSTRRFMRELNRLGVTSVADAGGGLQRYPEDYRIIEQLHARGQMTLRVAYSLFTQNAGAELADFTRWAGMVKPGQGDDMLRCVGAGEMLVFSGADFENFVEPRPDLAPRLELDLERVVRFLAEQKWPFRMHATYNESIERFLSVLEAVQRDVPLNDLRWLFDHCETISDRNLERVMALGGGIAVQHRMAFQGEHFVERHGAEAASRTPPIRRMLEMGVPLAAGTDATRVASYNPFIALYWMTTGKTVGGLSLYSDKARLSRLEALRLFTQGGTWMTREDGVRGAIAEGQLADLAVLSADYFDVPDEQIKELESVLTIVGGKPVYATAEFGGLDPGDIPVLPDWSPPPRMSPKRTDHVFYEPGCDCFAF